MDPINHAASPSRPQWDIDRCLERLIGYDVRVAAEAFFPVRWNGEVLPAPIQVRDLVLSDNSQPGALPVFFEGRLCQFERRIGVVSVHLDTPTLAEKGVEGTVRFRGRMAVILHGPAVVRLAFPFRVERLPADALNYWEDLRFPTAQFRLPFDSPPETVLYPATKEP